LFCTQPVEFLWILICKAKGGKENSLTFKGLNNSPCMKKHLFYWLALTFIVITGCQKELSFELGNTPAKGSLQSDVTGDCLPKTVSGIFVAGTPLVPATNTISVSVNVTRTGVYTVYTDTVNGYFFRSTGTFSTLGANTVILRSNGTPFINGSDNFVVNFDSTFCDIQVTVLPVGSGPATYTLTGSGTPASCTTPILSGTYVKGGAMNVTNTVVLNVNTTVAGTYSITTVLTNGMTFSGTGSLAVGVGTITLIGSGTPVNSGNITIPVTFNTTNCNFVIPVLDPVAGTLGGGPGACTPVTPSGTYTINVPLTATNTIQVQITTAAIGPYSVTTNTVAGISFSGSGTSTGVAGQTITLLGTGTPTASGTQNFTITFGTSTCTFSILIGTGLSAFTADCATAIPDGLYEAGTQLNASNTVGINVNVTAIGPYSITTTAVNGMVFTKSGTFTMPGITPITLVGSGTPVAAGTFSIPMPGTTPCNFSIVVDPPLSAYQWQFTVANAPTTIYRGENDDVQFGSNPPIPGTSFVLQGSNASGSDFLAIILVDISGTINNGETYSTSATLTNAALFNYDLPSPLTDTYSADPSTTGFVMTFTVTTHNVGTKTITGTFSGTAKNSAGQTININTGTFTGTYP
jgi:hypothetical protein